MEVSTLAIITRSKGANQNLIAIEDTSSKDFPHLSELDRIVKTTMKDIKEVEIPPQKLEQEIRELPFQIEDGSEP